MYGPAAFRKRDFRTIVGVADVYPAFVIGSRAVALMGKALARESLQPQ